MATMEQLVKYALRVCGDDTLKLKPVPLEYYVSPDHREALHQTVRARINKNVAMRTASSIKTKGYASW